MPSRRAAARPTSARAPAPCRDRRARAPRSRARRGATSSPNSWSRRGSSPARMNVPMPSSSARRSEPIGEIDRVGGELPDVQEPADLARIAADGFRRLVDRRVALREVARLHVPQRREPAIAFAPGQREHARLVGADPDRDVVSRSRPALGAVHMMVPPVGEDAAPLARVPQFSDHVDRLLEGGDGLAGAEPGAAHRLDRVPEAAGAEGEVEASAGEEIEAGRASEPRPMAAAAGC